MNVEPELIPKPVPAVDQPVEVVPAGSINNCGLLVVAVPVVNQIPESSSAGVEAAPGVELVSAPLRVMGTAVVAPRAVTVARVSASAVIPLELDEEDELELEMVMVVPEVETVVLLPAAMLRAPLILLTEETS